MSKWLEERDDGSLAFFIDGDLQFDSRDERNYHEALALPALALARQGKERINALIVGGGDGLTARELLKAAAVERVDLVDYDPEVLELGRTAFARFNDASFSDRRLCPHVADAWAFVEEALRAGLRYDVIIVDLTVAQDLAGARFHSIQWYDMLRQLLGGTGVLASNAVSPSATPEAYFSIFNGIRAAGLNAVPYRVFVPSFTNLGYGPDWGFILASSGQSMVDSLRNDLELEGNRLALGDCEHLRKLFVFPAEVFEYQQESLPASGDSEILLHYLYNADDLTLTSSLLWNALEADLDDLDIPQPDCGGNLLPRPICSMLAAGEAAGQMQSGDQSEILLFKVLEMMPALHKFHTRQIIADFLRDPSAFLEGIDLVGLVEELMRRAAELPGKIVTELQLLQEKLSDWAGDHLSLLQLGSRIMTIVTVVVILGNLLYPDAVYGKGGHGDGGHGAHPAAHAGAHATRDWNRGDFAGHHHDNWGHWNAWGGRYGHWGGWARPWHRWWGGGWGGWVGWAPWAGWGMPVNAELNVNSSVDEQGNQYPPRNYNYNNNGGGYVTNYMTMPPTAPALPAVASETAAPAAGGQAGGQAAIAKGIYRLGPDADILPDGKLVMHLTSTSYLLLGPSQTQVIDQATGTPVMALFSDQSLHWHLANEMQRQQKRLEAAASAKRGALDSSNSLGFQQQSDKSKGDLGYMQKMDALLALAQEKFGPAPDAPPPPERAPVAGALEIFTSAWMTPDGNWLLIKQADGSVAYMNAHGLYSDEGKTKLSAPYPQKFKAVVTAYLTNLTKEAVSATATVTQDKQEAQQRLQKLNLDMQNLLPAENAPITGIPESVQFGTETVQQPEALRRTKLAIRRAQHRLDFLNKEAESIPVESAAATKMLAHLSTAVKS